MGFLRDNYSASYWDNAPAGAHLARYGVTATPLTAYAVSFGFYYRFSA